MGARVLVIEDNADNLELVCYLLRAYGHTALAAIDGASGLALARSAEPDLILCDILMPNMDGYEVARQLRADPATSGVPLVAVTASARPSDRARVLEVGFDGYFSKPIDPETFVAQIEAFLPPSLRTSQPSQNR